ncbi:Fc.00g045970.m01.CDS01 [Cosmosporella sp. VM-42]
MAAPQPTSASPSDPPSKAIHSLILDTGPLIKNDPPVSTLLAKAEQLYTLPSIIPEIRDAVTRTRVETQLLPFVTLRSPKPDSIKFITAFARRTGDLAVLSRPDIEVLALGYELECERNGGDWRLRNTPGQKRLNGRPNENKATEETGDIAATAAEEAEVPAAKSQSDVEGETQTLEEGVEAMNIGAEEAAPEPMAEPETEPVQEEAEQPPVTAEAPETPVPGEKADETPEAIEEDSDDEGGWITPSNLKKHQAQEGGSAIPSQPLQKTLQAAVLTSDYAMQNVALRMNLNLVAPSLARITHLKNWVLRCHGCFTISKDMNRQFCPSCGQPTLIRTSCSTDANGNFKVHLKKNFQWNNRGNVYSVPKPVHGSSNGRLPNKNAGGQNGWGRNLILAEDQKEFLKANDEQRRTRKKDIMDQDYLPDLLTGHRTSGNGKIRVGAGRGVNSKKKH